MSRKRLLLIAPVLVAALLGSGCATKKYVKAEVSGTEGRLADRVGEVENQVEANQTRLQGHEGKISSASKTAQEALERALAAGKLAEGKLLYETVLSNDKVRFAFDKAELTDDAKEALDAFAGPLKQNNEGVYIEIQGHTDSTGDEAYNVILGQHRAEAALRYLNQQYSIPLHRMATISYGESASVADNSTREGRAQNRRVVLVVLQ